MYYYGQNELIFNYKAYIFWLITGFLHGVVAYFVPLGAIYGSINNSGWNDDLWYWSVNVYTCVIVIVSYKLFFYERYFNRINVLGFVLSILAYILWLMVADNWRSAKTYLANRVTTLTALYWFLIFVTSSLCLLIDYFVLSVIRFWSVRPGFYLFRRRNQITHDKSLKERFMNLTN